MISNLIDPDLLRKVRAEIQQNLSFTPKETDIYKIHQSGDLANLDGLDDSSLRILPSLKRLRDALYSKDFREYLCKVTDSSFLSGKKTDMAINVYTPGCHLLCHDDVIGSRRVSYILYLTDPDRPWKEEWGGALRLYPIEDIETDDKETASMPRATHSESIPPVFNQLSFFAVQPGESFHDVEEVYAVDMNGEDSDKERVRMAISGWYHIPQEGEEGYISGEEGELAKQSSLAQLQGMGDKHDRPQPKITSYALEEEPKKDVVTSSQEDSPLSEQDLDFLLKYIAPTYLTPDTHDEISDLFQEECCLLLDSFLCRKFSDKLRKYLTLLEATPDNHEESPFWQIARPPHKHRYLYQRLPVEDSESPIRDILTNLFPSSAFHKWLQLVTGQTIKSHDVLARRFRRSQDYTLAQSYESEEPRIEMCLSITPSSASPADETNSTSIEKASTNATKTSVKEDVEEVEEADTGGYLAYMAGDHPDDGNDGSHDGVEAPLDMCTGGRATKAKRSKADPAVYQAQADDEDDGVLFSMPAGWNKLGIVLRDQGTMRFVKYVSRQAAGDRWDIFGEFEIDAEQSDNDVEDATTIHDDEINDNEENDDHDSDDEEDDDDD